MKTYIIITALALINYSALPPFWALLVTARVLSVYPIYFKIDGVYIYSVTLIRSILDFFPLTDIPSTTDPNVNTRSHFGCILFHLVDAVYLQPGSVWIPGLRSTGHDAPKIVLIYNPTLCRTAPFSYAISSGLLR